ncbi:MAG: hypothetical protein U9N78_11045 [Actinomycetota bacterium]|nr:hypothetical protein [Actinomycetota bacterium]
MPSGRRSKPPEVDLPVFFLDRSLGRVHVAAALRDRGIAVVLMAELYPDGADQHVADDQWIADVSALGGSGESGPRSRDPESSRGGARWGFRVCGPVDGLLENR